MALAYSAPVNTWATARKQEAWRAGFCGCFDDCTSCCLSWCFPCVQYGQNANMIDGSNCCGACCLYYICLQVGCCCLIHGGKRTMLRANYGLGESCCCDCFVTWCCACCALSQEARELLIRGPPQVQVMSVQGPPTPIMVNINNTGSPNNNMQQQQYPGVEGGSPMFTMVNGQLVPVSPNNQQVQMSPQGQYSPQQQQYPPQQQQYSPQQQQYQPQYPQQQYNQETQPYGQTGTTTPVKTV